jgi:hypothetical protein
LNYRGVKENVGIECLDILVKNRLATMKLVRKMLVDPSESALNNDTSFQNLNSET